MTVARVAVLMAQMGRPSEGAVATSFENVHLQRSLRPYSNASSHGLSGSNSE